MVQLPPHPNVPSSFLLPPPTKPTYSPKTVMLAFYYGDDDVVPYYTSKIYSVDAKMLVSSCGSSSGSGGGNSDGLPWCRHAMMAGYGR